MKLLGEYENGNYNVKIFDNGTKIRETTQDSFIATFPESIDINITDKCDNNCPFCYAGATIDGKHGDILNVNFINTLKPFTEIAINGNDLSHPDLITFLEKIKRQKVITNMTVNQTHFEKYYGLIFLLIKEKLIKGLGVSLNNPTKEFIKLISVMPNTVIHVVNGIVTLEQLQKLYDKNLKILILGYKKISRGKDYYLIEQTKVKYNQMILYKTIKDIIPYFQVISFDNLALKQLNVKRLMSKKQWNEFYMGNDGDFTMYIDIPKNYFAKSSVCDIQYDLLEDIQEMFNIIRG